MRISILDQAPIPSGLSAYDTLIASMELAKLGETLGYKRYWIAEHHDFSGLACSAPEVMLGYIGANTSSIKIGCGAVLLPHYKPYKIAETYNLLATLFPGRIDIGIGRAPGASAEATMALNDNFLAEVRKMPEKVRELIAFIKNDFPNAHDFSRITAVPYPDVPPLLWILGTSEKSAVLAAENGTAYAFGYFMTDSDPHKSFQTYNQLFQKNKFQTSQSILAVSAICANSSDEAHELAQSSMIWGLQLSKGEGIQGVPSPYEASTYKVSSHDEQTVDKIKKKMLIGNPQEVVEKLLQLKRIYQVDEIMIVTITHRFEDRLHSYRLIANELKRLNQLEKY